MNDELMRQLESQKIDKAERQMVHSTLNEQMIAAKEGLAQGQKEVQAIARDGAAQAADGVRRLGQIEEYIQGLVDKFKNGFMNIPEIRLG